MVGEQPEVPVGGNEGEDPLSFPALVPNTRVEADIIQQPRILGERGRGPGWFGGVSQIKCACESGDVDPVRT